jgi:hypothetical protein
MEEKKPSIKRFTDWLFGGINMSWLTVLLFAVGTAVLTAVFLIVPIFKDTSFERMGVTLEAWILFAVIIMSNCKKPLESALKTFVFFLVSQPLIYLIQVPFSWMGWGLFSYYRYWFILTLLTFPAAFVGWFITKRNWLSVLIFAPVLAFLGYTAYACVTEHHIVAAVFCVLQIVLYVLGFFPNIKQRIVGLVIPVCAALLVVLITPKVDISITEPLPDGITFSQDAVIETGGTQIANIQLADPETGTVYIRAQDYGNVTFYINDGGTRYTYDLHIFDDNGVTRTKITLLEENKI